MSNTQKFELDFISPKTEVMERAAIEDKPKKVNMSPVVWLKIKNGEKYQIRILPPATTEGPNAYKPYIKLAQHWKLGDEQNLMINCPKKSTNGKLECEVCDLVDSLYATKMSYDKKKAEEIKASKGFYYQVIDRSDFLWKETDEPVIENPDLLGKIKKKFLRLPWGGHKYILNLFNEADYGEICHPINGLDLTIKRSGDGYETEYDVLCVPDRRPIFGTMTDPDLPSIKEILGALDVLDEHPYLKISSSEEIQAVLSGKPKNQEQGPLPSVANAPLLTGKSSQQPMSDPLDNWNADGAQFPLMDRGQVATWASKQLNQVFTEESVPSCYGVEPDHLDQECHNCKVKGPCASFYCSTNNRYSINDQTPKSAAMAGKSSMLNTGVQSSIPQNQTTQVSNSKESNEAELLEMLQNAAKS